MDKRRNRIYDNDKNNIEEEVVRMITFPQTKPHLRVSRVRPTVDVTKKKPKRSALEIADSIGVYGAFGRTLTDLHKQGR